MIASSEKRDPMDPTQMTSLKHWGGAPAGEADGEMKQQASVDCGWGRLIFGQTYESPESLADELLSEQEGQRDVALYMRDPNVVLSYAPQQIFLDPSLTYRLALGTYEPPAAATAPVEIRRAETAEDEEAINRIYKSVGMVPFYPGFVPRHAGDEHLVLLVAKDSESGAVVGVVTGVDHKLAIGDPDHGASLWSLAVDPQCPMPRVGMRLVHALASIFKERGRVFMDLSVMHDNEEAISLYRKIGFEQVPVYCLKTKNVINEPLFVGPEAESALNIYARIIVDEARRRGISVEVEDAENGFFKLSLGGQTVSCRESLSDFTTAVAMSRCDDKAVTRKLLSAHGLKVPAQMIVEEEEGVRAFLEKYARVVVKPARGEQGRCVFVDLRNMETIRHAIDQARTMSDKVVMEEFVEGDDLRLIVIDGRMVAAAVRRPASIRGDGVHTVRALIEKQSRRRSAATRGESAIPLDAETERAVQDAGYGMEVVLPKGVDVTVRKTANLHTGGTIHDVTDHVHPQLIAAAVEAARVLEIPVVGFDFLVPDVTEPDYRIIEANERVGLANHEPQPTAERFIDFLFPQTRMRSLGRGARQEGRNA